MLGRSYSANRAPLPPPQGINKNSPQAKGLAFLYVADRGGAVDETVYDYSGNKRHGQFRGAAVSTVQIPALSAHGWHLNGTSNYIRLVVSSSDSFARNHDYTVTMWLRAHDNDAMFFDRRGATVGESQVWGTNQAGDEPIRFGDTTNYATSTNLYDADDTNGGDLLFLALAIGGAGAGTTASTGYFYNLTRGQFERVPCGTPSSAANNTTLLFGVDADSGEEGSLGNYSNCEFYSIRGYDRKLTDGEIRAQFSPQTRWELFETPRRRAYRAPAAASTTILISMPVMAIAFSGLADIVGNLALVMPVPAVDFDGLESMTGNLNLAMPVPAVDFDALADIVGALDISMSVPDIAFSGVESDYGTVSLAMPVPAVQFDGIHDIFGDLALTMAVPAVRFNGTGGETVNRQNYRGFVKNLSKMMNP